MNNRKFKSDKAALIAEGKAVDEHGFESLRAIKQPGRPYKLSDAQKEEIKVAVASRSRLFINPSSNFSLER